MKNKSTNLIKLTLTLMFISIFSSGFSQQDAYLSGFYSNELTYENFASEFGNFVHEKMDIYRLNEKDIKGSPYLNAEFSLGTVYTKKNVHYTQIPLRYNIYNDVIEFKLQNDSIYAISNPEIIRQIEIAGETFFYCRTAYNKAGYFSLKHAGEVQLLSKYNIGFKDEVPAGAYAQSTPPTFKSKANTFFIKIKDEAPVSIAKKNDLKKIFGKQSNELLSFIKKEKLNIREEEDLIKLVEYINQSK